MQLSDFTRRYVLPHWPWYLAGLAALATTNILTVQIAVQLAAAIDGLDAPDAHVAVPRKAALIALMGLGSIAVRTISRVAFFGPGRWIERDLRHDLFTSALAQQPSFMRAYPPGDLVSRATSDTNAIRLLVGFGALQVINTVAACGLAIAAMARMSLWLTFLTLIPIAIAWILTQYAMRGLFPLMRALQEQLAQISDQVLSSYQGVSSIHAHNATDAFLGRFDTIAEAYRRTTVRRANLRTAFGPLLALSASLGLFVLIWQGGALVHAGQLTIGQVASWVSLLAMLVGPLRGISFVIQIVKASQVSLQRLGTVIDAPPLRPDLPNPIPAPASPPSITVRHLRFAYGPEPVLDDVSFAIAAGGTLGIVGPTGSGKTTLLRLIARLEDPPPGAIEVDGHDVRSVDLLGWRRNTAFVPQRAFLFSESLADNILLGVPDDGRLAQILGATTLDVDIHQLPDGVRTVVGEAGVTLSGGQRQRSALARGLVREHRLLMLDDVLSAVDANTERKLLETLEGAKTRPTTLLVSNRLSAVQSADHIVVLDRGHIVDQGRHAELIARPGWYRDVWIAQTEAPPAESQAVSA